MLGWFSAQPACGEAVPLFFSEQVRGVEVLADDVHVQRRHRRYSMVAEPARRRSRREYEPPNNPSARPNETYAIIKLYTALRSPFY